MHLGRVITSPRCTVGRVNPSSSAFYQSKGRVDGSLDEPMVSRLRVKYQRHQIHANGPFHPATSCRPPPPFCLKTDGTTRLGKHAKTKKFCTNMSMQACQTRARKLVLSIVKEDNRKNICNQLDDSRCQRCKFSVNVCKQNAY